MAQAGKVKQHLRGKFDDALALVVGEVTGQCFGDKIGRGDFMFGILGHKTYQSNCLVLGRVDERGGTGLAFFLGAVGGGGSGG